MSLERFNRYLAWANGNRSRALGLYALNMRLSEALYTPMQMLEVALRNRIHAVLSSVYHAWWFDAPGLILVAGLTFSFWTAMLGTSYENLWQMELHRVASRDDGKGLRRKDLSGPLTPIRLLRNRIAHHEPILSWDLPKHHDAMLRITAWLSPVAAVWCRSLDRFDQVYPSERIDLNVEDPAMVKDGKFLY